MNPDPTMGGGAAPSPQPPPTFFHMFNDDPKNVYLYSSITHSMKHSMYLFVSLFDSLSFMQCSRFCPPNAMGGRRCTLPPNPPPVLTKIRMDSLLFIFFFIFLIFLWSSKFYFFLIFFNFFLIPHSFFVGAVVCSTSYSTVRGAVLR